MYASRPELAHSNLTYEVSVKTIILFGKLVCDRKIFCTVLIDLLVPVYANNWSYEPQPRTALPATNDLAPRLVIPDQKLDSWFVIAKDGERQLTALFEERLAYAVGSRFNPLQQVEWLVRETPSVWVEEWRTKDGRTALWRGLKLTAREFGTRVLGVGGFVGELASGRKIGTIRPSPSEPSEGIVVWKQQEERYGWFREVDPLRELPYAALGYRKTDWFGTPIWEFRARGSARNWHEPRLELFGSLYASPSFSFDVGVQFQQEPDREGSFFARGNDQRSAVFAGSQWRGKMGTFFAGVSGPTPRATIAYWHQW